ncbi:MAG: phosphotransferase [Gammaproteobacteria bacterium]|nr:phosphotransferase [Gammaproteobacteria bacterium]MDH5801640.1 phosphotransferase [Gammaproteobacteria bacterium]
MSLDIKKIIKSSTGANYAKHVEDIQSLWSGYGKIMRYALSGGESRSVVVKHVRLPDRRHHPRGWDTDLSHQRKIRSYHVESAWYRDWAGRCDGSCRVPNSFALEPVVDAEEHGEEFLMVLEDLDASGYPVRKSSANQQDIQSCLSWLANFHATFMDIVVSTNHPPEGLWPVGTYWHLQTRPDELAALSDIALKQAAAAIDARLNAARFQTVVHGDAKLANFCFPKKGYGVAAVDFQYVGGGCGMKDVAYFIGSCLQEEDCERNEFQLLQFYFSELQQALSRRNSVLDFTALEAEWRELYAFAWTDFHRFLKGWSPGHWKINDYSERLARQVLQQVNGTGRCS